MSENGWKSFWKLFFLTAWIAFVVLLILKLVGVVTRWLVVFAPLFTIAAIVLFTLLIAALASFGDEHDR